MARYVTVASISERPPAPDPGRPDALLDHAAHLVWRAKQHGADIVAFPEIYPHWHLGKPSTCAEELSSRTTTRIMEEARKLGVYVIWPQWERQGEDLYNAAVLIDRKGEVAGVYHKVHPTVGEIDDGIIPGTDYPTFETDFGRIGMAICFDLNFPDIMRGLAANGAEVIFFCSAYRGGLQVQFWAFELGVYLVASVGAEYGRIVDLTGQVLRVSTYESLIAQRINLDRVLLHMDGNWDKMDSMLEKYGTGVRFDYVTPEACYAVSSEREGLSVQSLIEEFGLEGRRAYFDRSNMVRAQALERRGML